MLKPVEPDRSRPERPIGELVHELIEDGKAYARAEIDLLKAIAAAKGKALAILPATVRRRLHLRSGGDHGARGRRGHRTRSDSSARSAAGFVGMLIFAAVAGAARLGRLSAAEAGSVSDTPGHRSPHGPRSSAAALALMATAQELQERLSPKVLAKGAWQGAKEKGADLAEDAVDAVRARPLAATGVVAAIAMFLAREPLIGSCRQACRWGRRESARPRKARKAKSTQQSTEKAQ